MVEITLPDWLYQAIKKTKVLKISSDYFRIRKAIDRRLYEIARKHCGNQYEFVVSLKKLHLKTGSTANLAKFKFNIKQLEKLNDLPDYTIVYDPQNDNVIFTNRDQGSTQSQKSKTYKSGSQTIYKIKNMITESKKKNTEKKRKKLKQYSQYNNSDRSVDECYEEHIKTKIPKGFRK